MYNPLDSIFSQTLRRESKTVTATDSGETFQCFFRKNSDTTETRDTMIMYYPVSAPVAVGTLLTFSGNYYLTLNKETAENEVYYKSAVIRTNGTISTQSLSCIGLPIYADDANNTTVTQGTYLTIIDGNIEVLAPDNDLSRALEVNDIFNEYGRTWEVSNIYYVDGIAHIMLEVTADTEISYEYELELGELSSYNVAPGDTDTLTATATCNGTTMSAALIYDSSDEDVATIDESGNIEYLADGEVYFIVTWADGGISSTTAAVTVLSEASGDEAAIYVTPIDTTYYGFEDVLTYYVTVGGVKVDAEVTFSIENSTASTTLTKKITVTDNGDGTVTLMTDSSQLIGNSFDLVAYCEEYDIENRQTIAIRSAW